MTKGLFGRFIVVCSALLLCAGCGSSSSTTTTDDTTEAAVTDLSKAAGSDVVVASVTAEISTADASANAEIAVGKQGEPPEGEVQGFEARGSLPGDAQTGDFKGKQEARQAMFEASGETSCLFTVSFPTVSDVTCYGPTVDYSNHPGATNPQEQTGQLPIGDTGIWDATEGTSGEACSAAKMTEVVEKASSKVDMMLNIIGSMICAGKKAGAALPAEGETVDLLEEIGDKAAVDNLSYTTATVERLADDSSGNDVYESTAGMTVGPAGSQLVGTIINKHIPLDDSNSTYKGKLSFSAANSNNASAGMNCQQINQQTGETGSTFAGVIRYHKASATSLKIEFEFAEFCGTDSPLDSSNNINLASTGGASGWGDNGNYGVFSVNPEDGTGDVAYCWQAGHNDGRTRCINVSTSSSGGVGSGTSYVGFGPAFDDTAGTKGSLDGFVCNWAGPGGATQAPNDDRSAAALNAIGRGVAKVQRQELARAAGATVFTPTGDNNFTYAVTNSCDVAEGSNFAYRASNAGQNLNLDNDRTGTAAVTNTFIALTAVDFTVPTPPDDV